MSERIINVNTAEQYKKDYKLYALYVCRHRVTIDLRDGLKPVVRKILYSAFTFKSKTKYPNTTKSAQIVGDVMANYHPHGDCIHGSTLLYGVDGSMCKIEDLYNGGINSLMILAVDPVTLKSIPALAYAIRIGQHTNRIYHIKFSNGYKLSCTSNHPIMMANGEWVKAEDIVPGMVPMTNSIRLSTIDSSPTQDIVITGVEVEELAEPIPMYDFTVDGFENMLIPMGNKFVDECLPMLCIHNSGIYGAMKPMSNEFEIYIPLLNKQGSWGDKFGKSPAAMRYTEAGLSQFSQEYLLKDLYDTPNCVDWLNTFNNDGKEPECLPAAVPIALIEGTFGIAVGFKVEIPKHNINEVIDATIRLIRNKDSKVTLIPDHCQPCEIVDTDFDTISNTGHGSYTVRGIIEKGEFSGEPSLFLKSAPDLIYLQGVKDNIEKLIISKKLINVTRMDNHNDELVIRFKRGTDLAYAKQLIYQYTRMETTCRVNFEVLDNMVPMRMSYKSYILQWLEFRKFTKFRLYCNRLQMISTKIHTIEPFVKIARSNDIFDIINMIKNKDISEEELMEILIKKYDITDLQAKFILNVRIKDLSESFFKSHLEEYNKLEVERAHYMELLTNENAIEEDIVQELTECKRKYNKKRNCRIISKGEAGGIPSGSFKMIFTQNNFIKKIPVNESIPTFKNDAPKFIIPGDNAENLIIFNEMGKCFKLPIHKIPFSDKRSNGIDVRLLIKNCTSNINAVMYEPKLKDFINKLHKYYIVTLTRNGYIKKMDIDDFMSANASGLIYAKLDDGDYIKDVMIISESSDVVVYSTNNASRFSMEAVPYLKRATRGNKTMNTEVDGLSIIKKNTTDIIVVTKKGFVNRFSPVALLSSDRTSKSSKVIKLSKGDEILSVFGLSNMDTLIINAASGRVTIPVDTIPIGSSIGGGTKMVPNKGDTIISCGFFHNKS